MKYRNNLKQRLSGRHYACADAIDYRGKKIINLGCGNGAFEFLVADKAKEIVGVEIKDEDLFTAREECKTFGNVNFVEANILEDNFPEEQICDVVTMFDVIEHVPKDTEPFVLGRIHKMLRPRGQVVISTPLENKTKFFDPAWYLKPKHRHYTKEQLVEMANEKVTGDVMVKTADQLLTLLKKLEIKTVT